MAIELKMPALSPTMEEGTLAKWLVKEGDSVTSGDLLAEIETDKATMEFEAVDEGVVSKILVAEGTEGVKVGSVIALIGSDASDVASGANAPAAAPTPAATPAPAPTPVPIATPAPAPIAPATSVASGARIKASPLAKRIAATRGVDLASLSGSGPNGRIIKADVEAAGSATAAVPLAPAATAAPIAASAAPVTAASAIPDFGIPHEDIKLSNMRKTIAKRLTQSMVEAPHIYLSVDVQLDALLKLRGELNTGLADRGVKLSVNDMLIKALALALEAVPQCNVSFGGDVLRQYHRSDISVAVSIPGGLITPIITDAASKSLSKISTEMAELAERAKAGKLQPHEYQGGTASISNMGMMGIKHFTAVINPPQAMILAVGAGEKRPYVVDDALAVATVMTVTGSFDHRAIDGADGAQLIKIFKQLVEKPMGLVA
ncbi:MAG: pyruvate dehydrogenase complex dihydrolipoamide acetyltransferase [Sphingomonadaceae bacterium]|nr:pyruvate dehydrogenase complex dihydrolipoamide acetyltransferase [Sphingomonadaceae bacterium]